VTLAAEADGVATVGTNGAPEVEACGGRSNGPGPIGVASTLGPILFPFDLPAPCPADVPPASSSPSSPSSSSSPPPFEALSFLSPNGPSFPGPLIPRKNGEATRRGLTTWVNSASVPISAPATVSLSLVSRRSSGTQLTQFLIRTI
jgi:hypothetical protein